MLLEALFRLSDFDLFCLLATVFVLGSILCVTIIKHFIPLEARYKDNHAIGTVGSLISLIYGVLVGITALYLINNLTATSDAVQHEADATANLYRDSKLLKEPQRSNIDNAIKKYLEVVINSDWPRMKSGKDVTNEGNVLIEDISSQLMNYNSFGSGELLVLHDMLDEIKSLYNARAARLEASNEALSGELWEVILIGTVLMLAINFISGVHFYFHLLTVSAAAIMATSILFLLITMDKPFQGEFVIEASAFQSVLSFIHDQEKLKLQAPQT